MDDFVRYLIIVGAIVLVITLIIFYIIFSYSKASNTWPPEEMQCPDYWKATNGVSGIECEDYFHLTSRDDNNNSLTYNNGERQMYKWTNEGPDTTITPINRGNLLTDMSYGMDSGLWKTHCGKKIWAQQNGVSWDGITNSNIQCTESGYLENPDDIYANSS